MVLQLYCRVVFLVVVLTFGCGGSNSAQIGSWSNVGTGVNGFVDVMCEYNSELYVAGGFTNAGGVPANNIAKWNGSVWDNVTVGLSGYVYALCVYNGELYAGGMFNLAGSLQTKKIAKWNGTSWSAVGGGVQVGNHVGALYVYNGKLIVGGQFTQVGTTTVENIAEWDGTNWSDMGGGLTATGATRSVWSMTEWNGMLYAAGYLNTIGNISYWDGNAWNALNESLLGPINSITVHQGELFAGGNFSNSSGPNLLNNIARYDGSSWYDVGGGTDNSVISLCSFGTNLYVAGNINFAGGNPMNYVTCWDNSAFISMDNGVSDVARSLYAFNAQLFCGGDFDTIGNLVVSGIASWTSPGIGMDEQSTSAFVVFPNPSSGIFSLINNEFSADATISIFSCTGQLVKHFAMRSKEISIDLSEEPSGIYVVMFENQSGIFARQTLIVH